MTQTPTDALRLVPTAIDKLEAVYDWLREPDYGDTFNKNDLVEWLNRRPSALLMTTIGELRRSERAAAPASPLPGGGDMDWQDKAEGLEADLRQAVLVAWKRGAEEWCRLNYPQWVEWLESCHAPAAPTGEPK